MPTTILILGVAVVSVLVAMLGIILAVRNFYVVPRADEALVKTGGGTPVVSTGGGLWVIPMFHRVAHVPLKAVRIPIERVGENALPTSDKIMAEIRGELIVRVSPSDPTHIVLAAQSLGAEGSSQVKVESIIQQQVDSLVTDALRTAAFKKTFEKLNSEKAEFADEVTQLLAGDLGKLGLVLVAVTVPHLKQGEFTKDGGDVFAAEGLRNVAETVAKNRQETNRINREAEIKVQEQDVDARKKHLDLAQKQREMEAMQSQKIAEFVSQRETETTLAQLKQQEAQAVNEAQQKRTIATKQIQLDQETEEAQIQKNQAVGTKRAVALAEQKKSEEEAERAKQEAEIARAKAVESAQIEKDQTIKVAEQQRTQAIAEAEISREVAVAKKRAEEAAARGAQATAEAERQRAEQTILTVEAESKADRERKVVVIKADEEAQKAKVAADRDAYVLSKRAEGESTAAVQTATAVKAAAQGAADAVTVQAEGKAHALRVEVESRVEATKLEAQGAAEATLVKARAAADARLATADAESVAASKEAAAKTVLAEALRAEGQAIADNERALLDARNVVNNSTMLRDVALAFIAQSPNLMRELMAPVAKVSDVKVLQINGLGGGAAGGDSSIPSTIMGAGLAASGALPLLRAALEAFAQNPEIRAMAASVGQAMTNTIQKTAAAVREPSSN